MTDQQKQRLAKLEKMYGTKADVVAEVLIVSFEGMNSSTFAVDSQGKICRACEVSDRAHSLTRVK